VHCSFPKYSEVTVLVAVVDRVVAGVADSVVETVLASVEVAEDVTEVDTVEVCVDEGEVTSQLWNSSRPCNSIAAFSSSTTSQEGILIAPLSNVQLTSYEFPGNFVNSFNTPSIARLNWFAPVASEHLSDDKLRYALPAP